MPDFFHPAWLAPVALSFFAAACGPSNGGGVPATYVIVFSLSDSPADLETLSFTVTYVNGDFSGSGSSVSCRLVADEDDETIVLNDDNDGTLTVAIDAEDQPLEEATDIVECDFIANEQPTSNDFVIVTTAAEPTDDIEDVDIVVTSTDLASDSSLGEFAE